MSFSSEGHQYRDTNSLNVAVAFRCAPNTPLCILRITFWRRAGGTYTRVLSNPSRGSEASVILNSRPSSSANLAMRSFAPERGAVPSTRSTYS